jgi:hypothetical protein
LGAFGNMVGIHWEYEKIKNILPQQNEKAPEKNNPKSAGRTTSLVVCNFYFKN